MTPPRTRRACAAAVPVFLIAFASAMATARGGPTSDAGSPQRNAEGSDARRAHVDRFGDPLPSDPLARFGTVRWRHPYLVKEAVFSPGGTTLASLDWDGVFRLWDVRDGHETLRRPGLHLAMAFAPDGKTIALDDINIQLLDASTGKELGILKGHRMSVASIAFSPDGKLLASSSLDGTIRIWNRSNLTE